MDKIKPPKKPFIFYYSIVMIIILVLNMLIVPIVSRASIEETSYSSFLQSLGSGAVRQVELQEDTILYVTEEENERRKKESISRQTIETTDKVIAKQMRIVQEIASLLGETAAETKIALTKLKESIGDE